MFTFVLLLWIVVGAVAYFYFSKEKKDNAASTVTVTPVAPATPAANTTNKN